MPTLTQTPGAIAMRKRRIKLQQLGLCTRCGKTPSIEDSTQCENCRSRKKIHKPKLKEKTIVRKCKSWRIVNHRFVDGLKRIGLTIPEFAVAINVTARQVERWAFEEVMPKIENRMKVKALLGEDYWK